LSILLRSFFFKTLWIVTIFPHMFFFKIIFIEFFFNIELVKNSASTFPACFFSIFFHFVLLLFFQNCLLVVLFFHFLCFFSKLFCWFFYLKTLWIATMLPTWFIFIFFMIFFPELSLSILFFSYWASWEFSFVVFFFKTLWISIVLPHLIFLFYDFFQNFLYRFYDF